MLIVYNLILNLRVTTLFFSREKYIMPLFLIGLIQGGFLEYWIIKLLQYWEVDLWKIFYEIKFFSIFSENLFLGIVIALFVQFYSVIFIWIFMYYDSKLYAPTTWLFSGISKGVLASSYVVNGNIVSGGFVLPYVFVLMIPCLLVFFTGTNAMAFLAIEALELVGLYGILLLLDFLLVYV